MSKKHSEAAIARRKKYNADHPNPTRSTIKMRGVIPLVGGLFTIVDDEDYDELMQYKWTSVAYNGDYYVVRTDNEGIHMHRQLLGLAQEDPRLVDHIDRKGLNNRKENLRILTFQQNIWTHRPIRGKSSRFKGVCKIKNKNAWSALIICNGVKHPLGTFDVEEDAARAYDVAARIYFEGYGFTNFNLNGVCNV